MLLGDKLNCAQHELPPSPVRVRMPLAPGECVRVRVLIVLYFLIKFAEFCLCMHRQKLSAKTHLTQTAGNNKF